MEKKKKESDERKNDDDDRSCSACSSKQAFRMASGPPFCQSCINEIHRLIAEGGTYVCSSISRRKDVIFAEPQPLADHLAKSLFVNKVTTEPNIVTEIDAKCNIGKQECYFIHFYAICI